MSAMSLTIATSIATNSNGLVTLTDFASVKTNCHCFAALAALAGLVTNSNSSDALTASSGVKTNGNFAAASDQAVTVGQTGPRIATVTNFEFASISFNPGFTLA
jgi:hypothetical protein